MAKTVADRARALVGTRFRAQGRDPRHGLDCVGLVLAAHGLGADLVRRDYRLRGDHLREMIAAFEPHFRRISKSRRRPGDVLLMQVAADQMHIAIATDTGFIHADAKLGAVVETPGQPAWKVRALYRRRVRRSKDNG